MERFKVGVRVCIPAVEVTVPKKGPPRPIRLGVKTNGVLTPLALD